MRGTLYFKIEDYREFIKLHKLNSFDLVAFQTQITDVVNRYVKNAVTNAPMTHNIPIVQIESRTTAINEIIERDLKARLSSDFGVIVSGVDVGIIDVDKSSDGYQQLMAVTKQITTATIQTQTAANLENYTETLRIQREESQYAQRMRTRSENLSAYQIEKQAEVGVAGAQALGKMGEHNTGSVNLGGNTGFHPAAMMAGMTLGGAVGQNLATTLNNAMQPSNNISTPPPIPATKYNVAQNGKSTGPFDLETLKTMFANGSLTGETLVWKQGMSKWEKANTIDELKGLFPPPLV